MTRLIGSVVITIALLGATIGTAQHRNKEDRSVTGSWSMTVEGHGHHGDMKATLALNQEGTSVTGRLVVHDRDHPVEGEFIGVTLKLSVTAEAHAQMTLTAALKDDGKLVGSLTGPDGALQWTAVR